MIYRPDIDGLRAIAVLGVIFFHADFGCDGGFVGVDVFFVISGFLITSLIIKDLRAGNFSILGFWERRARRIFPALFVVTIATIIFGYFLLLPRDFELLGGSVLWLSLFTSNVFFWRNTNSYFAGSAEEMPLLHTWSLSLEEQFYLVVPFALLLLFKWRKSSGLMWIVSLGVLLSLLISVLGTMRYESASFYLLPTRAWELGVGSMVALSKPLRSYPLKSAMAFVGILCVLVPFFIYDRSIPFPGLFAVPPVLGSALLILSGQNTKISDPVLMVTRILSIKPLVFIGLLSYSLYLWHWPLLAFNEYLVIGKNSLLIKSILILISFLLAFVSWRFIEKPIRSRSLLVSRFSIFSICSFGVAFLILMSSFVFLKDGIAGRVSEKVIEIDDRGLGEDSFFDYDLAAKGFPNNNLSLGVKNNEATFFLWGDSHAMAMARAIDLAAKELSVGGQSAIKSSTLPVLDWITSDSSQISYNNEIINHLSHEEQRKKIKHVILAGRWWLAFNQSIKNNKDFEDCLRQTITKVQSLGYSVSLVRQVPQWTDHWHTPSSFPFNFNVKDLSWVYNDLEISVSNLQVRFNDQNQMFEEIIKDFPNLRIIDPLPLLISSEQIYKFRENNKWNYYDDDHISADGARRLKSLFQFLGS